MLGLKGYVGTSAYEEPMLKALEKLKENPYYTKGELLVEAYHS